MYFLTFRGWRRKRHFPIKLPERDCQVVYAFFSLSSVHKVVYQKVHKVVVHKVVYQALGLYPHAEYGAFGVAVKERGDGDLGRGLLFADFFLVEHAANVPADGGSHQGARDGVGEPVGLPFCAEHHACRDVACIQGAARHDEGLVAVVTCDAHGHGRVGHGMSRWPAVKDSAPEKSPLEIAGTLAAIEFRVGVFASRNSLETIVVEERHGGSLHGDGTGVVQRAVVADKVHVARNKNREKRPHQHTGPERNTVGELALAGRKTGNHQVVIFHRELVRKRSAENAANSTSTNIFLNVAIFRKYILIKYTN